MIRHLKSCVQNRVGHLYADRIPALQESRPIVDSVLILLDMAHVSKTYDLEVVLEKSDLGMSCSPRSAIHLSFNRAGLNCIQYI